MIYQFEYDRRGGFEAGAVRKEDINMEVSRRIFRTAFRDIRLHIILLVVEVSVETQTSTCAVSNTSLGAVELL